MVETAARRRARSTAPGVSNGRLALATHALARVIRCSMALSLTRNARAICLTLSPETMRSASAIRWVARRPVLGPIFQGAQARFLVGLFGRIHVAEVAQQRGNRLGAGGYQRGIDPRGVVHSKLRLACSRATGLNS